MTYSWPPEPRQRCNIWDAETRRPGPAEIVAREQLSVALVQRLKSALEPPSTLVRICNHNLLRYLHHRFRPASAGRPNPIIPASSLK